MENTFLAIVFLLVSHCCFGQGFSAGGELNYTYVKDSVINATYTYYQVCNQSTQPSSYFTLITIDSCRTNIGAPFLLPRPNNFITEEGTGCLLGSGTCIGGVFPGYKSYVYVVNVQLPTRCKYYILKPIAPTVDENRFPTQNLSGTGVQYLSAHLDNTIVGQNSSPRITARPLFYACQNGAYVFIPNAQDPDGDSLVYEMVRPINYASVTKVTGYTPFAYVPYTSSFSITNPLPNNNYSFSPKTGTLKFTPTQLGNYSLAMRVYEYRNGALIGDIRRDWVVTVLPCKPSGITLGIEAGSVQGGSQVGTDSIEVRIAYPLSFCMKGTSTFPNAGLMAVNDGYGIAGPTISYTGGGTASLQTCVRWTPTIKDTGIHQFNLVYTDTVCHGGDSMRATEARLVTIYVKPPTVVQPPIGIANQPIAKDIKIYPNPASNLLSIKAPMPVNITITSIDGRVLKTANAASQVDITALVAGIYYVRVFDAASGALVKVERLVKVGE